ncbi:MAG: 2-amino-4-hydroxy-6-hydroxymethyldihydropteridine diphosphokinase [Candidatus Symbiobacter sp.]|nr:2-amino-4-hydroxy-6-hydroxymethyldihydropteridine diphosphokinase [Candidatus Symbiobacter sp.]
MSRSNQNALGSSLAEPAAAHEEIYLGLGSNLTTPKATPRQSIEAALDAIAQGGGVQGGLVITERSRLYKSAPIPKTNQPYFNNIVIKIRTDFSPLKLLGFLHGIEAAMGRVRQIRNEARVIDLDLLVFGARRSLCPDCMLPHPRLTERAFVLYPLRDIAPAWSDPISQKSITELIANLPPEQEIHVIN